MVKNFHKGVNLSMNTACTWEQSFAFEPWSLCLNEIYKFGGSTIKLTLLDYLEKNNTNRNECTFLISYQIK